jgi:hypothetical protein
MDGLRTSGGDRCGRHLGPGLRRDNRCEGAVRTARPYHRQTRPDERSQGRSDRDHRRLRRHGDRRRRALPGPGQLCAGHDAAGPDGGPGRRRRPRPRAAQAQQGRRAHRLDRRAGGEGRGHHPLSPDRGERHQGHRRPAGQHARRRRRRLVHRQPPADAAADQGGLSGGVQVGPVGHGDGGLGHLIIRRRRLHPARRAPRPAVGSLLHGRDDQARAGGPEGRLRRRAHRRSGHGPDALASVGPAALRLDEPVLR